MLVYIFWLEAAGAVPWASKVTTSPRSLRYIVMRKPPPMPQLCGLNTPLQNRTAMAESTAVPPLCRTSLDRRFDGNEQIMILF